MLLYGAYKRWLVNILFAVVVLKMASIWFVLLPDVTEICVGRVQKTLITHITYFYLVAH